MPPSSDQDSSNQTATNSSKSAKVTQKSSTVPTNTKGKKNGTAKESGIGGVMAAVKKDGKMTTKQSAQTAPDKSPEITPADSVESGSNPVTSPLLDAVSSARFAQTTTQNTNEWMKGVGVPGYSTSPGNLISLGESPPTQPSSYDDRLSHFGWNLREQRGTLNGHYHSVSPPAPNRRRPLSYTQLDGHTFPAFDDSRSQLPYANRRTSMYSPPTRYGPHPPPPHQPQAHFYGAPDPTLLLSPPGTGLVPGVKGYFCGFDKLPTSPTATASKTSDTVILTGYEGGLKVLSVTKRATTQLWSLEGLRGGVFSAKILPWIVNEDGPEQSPLVAVVVHGPVWRPYDDLDGNGFSAPEVNSLTPTESLQGSPRAQPSPFPEHLDDSEFYQTTVEIYSIPRNRHVATLLTLPKRLLSVPTSSPLFSPPPPDGSLTLRADGRNIVVTSGQSGESWIFRLSDCGSAEKFTCIGKIWTAVQHGITVEPGHISERNNLDGVTARKNYKASILSLSGRYLAYCPPNPSSQVALGAIIPSSISKHRIPGLNSRAPPQLPAVNCLVETPGDDSMVKQILQVGTQKFIEGATYLGGQGVQAWNNYWNKPAQNPSPPTGLPIQTQPTHFPPTHAVTPPAPLVTKEPGLIAVLDIEALAFRAVQGGHSIHPLATFRVPQGCSFLSFAPSGLALFTASSKGDTQFVWDLMRMQYAKPSFLRGGLPGVGSQSPHVRQIAQFTRMTIARIVDVVWTSPHGERAAMVTEPGTVHVLDLPASAFTWPPPRRKAVVSKPEDEAMPSSFMPASVVSNAASSLWTAAGGVVRRRRRSTAGMSAMNVTAQAAGHGAHAIAAGVSRSVGAATGRMNELRKSGTTKLHLPSSNIVPSRGCVLLINGRKSDSVLVVGGGIVRHYTIKNRQADRPADKQKASKGAKFAEFRLPALPNVQLAPRNIPVTDELELTEGDLEVPFTQKAPTTSTPRSHGTESSIPQAEIESNAPYQPFHTDRRVTLHVYSSEDTAPPSPSVSALLIPPPVINEGKKKGKGSLESNKKQTITPPVVAAPKKPKLLVFGLPIKTTKLDIGGAQLDDDDLEASIEQSRAFPASAIERVLRYTDGEEEELVITTRLRKGASKGSGHAEGGEEGSFEDDWAVVDYAANRV